MTTDERLDRLTERVDSLAHSVELLAGMQIETERKLAALTETVRRLGETTTQFAERIDDGLSRFARILVNHDNRIEALERRQ